MWVLNCLSDETETVCPHMLIWVRMEVTVTSSFLFSLLCSYSLSELLSLYLTLFSLSASHNPLHTSPESTWAFRKGHVLYIHTCINSSWAPMLTVVLGLHLSPSAVEIAWLLMAGNGYSPTPWDFQQRKENCSCVVCKLDLYLSIPFISVAINEKEKALY